MDKAVKRHILKKRIVLAKRSDEPMTFTERAPKFFKWFEEDVMGFDSEEYRREFWREAYRKGRTIGHVPHTLNDQLRSRGRRSEAVLFDALCISLLMGGAFAIWVMRRKIDLHLHRLRRPSYYESERARRMGFTEERRRIRRRTTINACPGADQLREAFLRARDSIENMIRLGSLMEDLECYIDNSLVFGEDGKIIARKGGIRRYIQSEIPDLYKSYKTLMRYKALARKFRQAVGISDPVPAASVLPEENEPVGLDVSGKSEAKATAPELENIVEPAEKNTTHSNNTTVKIVENMVRTNSQGVGDNGSEDGAECRDDGRDGVVGNSEQTVAGRVEEKGWKISDGGINAECGRAESGGCKGGNAHLNNEVRNVVREILDVCEGTFLDLAAVLALRISEDTIPHRLYKGDYRQVCA